MVGTIEDLLFVFGAVLMGQLVTWMFRLLEERPSDFAHTMTRRVRPGTKIGHPVSMLSGAALFPHTRSRIPLGAAPGNRRYPMGRGRGAGGD